MPSDRSDAPLAVEPLAPRWHTGALVGLMIAVAVTGTLLAPHVETAVAPFAQSRIVAVYLPVLLVDWGLTLYVCRIGRSRNALRSLLGRGWSDARRACADVALGVAGFLVIEAAEVASGPWRNAAVTALAPHSPVERGVWVLVAVSVGFCEEVIYRGYLQTQLAAFTRRTGLAIALQALLFGLAHGEQGLPTVARFALYGAGLGVLARWRRSLVAGILCHVAIDLAGGLLAR